MDTQGTPVQTRILKALLWASMLLVCLCNRVAHGAETLPFVLGAPFLTQQPMQLDAQERKWLDNREVLRVGVPIADYEPIDITTDRNRYQGISADYLSLVSAKLAMPVKVIGFAKRERAVAALLAGEIDLLTSANGYEKAIDGLIFTKDYELDQAVVASRGAETSHSTALNGKRVALLDGYADIEAVHQAYPQSEVILAPTLYSGMEALAHGDVDAFIGNEIIIRSYSALRPFLNLTIHPQSQLEPSGLSFAMRNDDWTLKALFDRALGDLDHSIKREVQGRWTAGLQVDAPSQRIRLTALEQHWVSRHPKVTVASTSHSPYVYRDETGKWTGLNIDVLDRISRMTGLYFEHQEMPTTQAALEALSSGKADMNTSLAETPERRKLLDFTYAYGGHNWVYVVHEDDDSDATLAEMSGKVLAMPERHALLEFIQASYPDVSLRLVATHEAARKLVESGEAQATIQNEVGAWMSRSGKLKVGRSVDGLWSPDRFGVVKTHPELLSIMNKALDQFPVAEMRTLRLKWLGAMNPPISPWQRIPAWVFWVLACALLLLLLSLFWNERLKAQLRRQARTEAQLRDQLALRDALVDGVPDPVYLFDLQGRLIACNRHCETCIGVSREQMSGRRMVDIELIAGASAERIHADCLSVLRYREPAYTRRTLMFAHRRIDVAQWMVPFYQGNGELKGVLGGWRDITEQTRLEREWAKVCARGAS